MPLLRRPPNTMPEIGTPPGSLTCGSCTGLLLIGAVKRLLGWAAGRPQPGVHGLPVQSRHSAGGSFVLPSHHTSPSGSRATFVEMVSWEIVSTAFGLVRVLVVGTTP